MRGNETHSRTMHILSRVGCLWGRSSNCGRKVGDSSTWIFAFNL